MKRNINVIIIVVFACLIVTFYAYNATIFANDEAGHKCVECGKPSNSHGGAITIDHDGEHLTFCCQGCANKHEEKHHDKSSKDEDNHDHGEHKGHAKH